jgi:large subunit ribosomal protein L22e
VFALTQYLTKKFLKQQQLRDYIRVIARAKGGYFLRYFNFAADDNDNEAADS